MKTNFSMVSLFLCVTLITAQSHAGSPCADLVVNSQESALCYAQEVLNNPNVPTGMTIINSASNDANVGKVIYEGKVYENFAAWQGGDAPIPDPNNFFGHWTGNPGPTGSPSLPTVGNGPAVEEYDPVDESAFANTSPTSIADANTALRTQSSGGGGGSPCGRSNNQWKTQ